MINKIIARAYVAWVHKLERKIGYQIKFSCIPQTWVNGWMISDMTKAWEKHGIQAIGVNYFTVGCLVGDLSSRFLKNEPQYQSWLGAYLVKFKNTHDFSLQSHFNLAVADQKYWLELFGDPKPYIEMPEQAVTAPVTITIDGYEAKLFEFLGGPSHSDVGAGINFKTKTKMSIMAAVMNIVNPGLKLHGNNFISENSYDYETVTLKGYIAIIELEKDTKLVIYGNGTEISSSDKQATDYYPIIKNDILAAFRSVKIENLKSDRKKIKK